MNQQQVHENHEMSHALYEDLAALKIRIAFAEISEAELDEYDRELSSVYESDYSEAAQKKALKLIERKLNKQLSKRFIRRTLPHAIQVSTIVMLLFFIGLTTAVATVRPVRLRLMDFIAQIEENYSAVGINYDDNDNTEVPEGWKGMFYPFYIPESFKLSHMDDYFNIVYYKAKDGRIMQFCEYADSVYSNVNIDEESAFDIIINESPGIAMTDGEGTTITWCVNDTYLTLYFSGDFEMAKRIASNVKRIRETEK